MLIRCTLISLSLLLSAFNFSQSARQMTHCGFMFPVANMDASGGGVPSVTPEQVVLPHPPGALFNFNFLTCCQEIKPRNATQVEKVMVTSENSQWAGLRWFYFAITSVVWLLAAGIAEPAGEWGFLGACLAMRIFFGKIDRPPRGALSVSMW